MGVGSSDQYAKKQKVIEVISLNYSGILLSPFEFFSKETKEMSDIQTDLSNIYKKLLKSYTPLFSQNKKENKFKWNLGKIDQKMQKERYSPLYNKTAGLKNNFKLMNQEEFKQKWVQVFKENIENFKQKQPGFKYTEEQMKEALEFDLLCYKSILYHVYKELKDFSSKQMDQLNSQKYIQFMNYMFDKSFLNDQKKLKKTLSAMQRENVDILFAQEANQTLINKLKSMKDYVVFEKQNSQSIIILRKERFHNFYNLDGKNPLQHLPELEKEVAWNNDTVIAFVDNLILISGHLSSKKEKNPVQVFQMMQSLKKLHSIYPMCHIIVGCDANSYVPRTYNEYYQLQQAEANKNSQNNKKPQNQIETLHLKMTKKSLRDFWVEIPDCQIYPSNPDIFTTSKQRTYLQPQINKAEEIARVCRDHLIVLKGSDLTVDRTKVCTILDKSPQYVQNLPCEQHPYDHYVVKASITVNVMTNFVQSYGSKATC